MQSINALQKLRRFIANSLGHREPESGYRYRHGDVVVEDFAEFSGVPLQVVVERINDFHRINADDWNALGVRSFSERAATFYE